MSTEWYCKNCGITEDAETNLPCGVVVCRACCHSVEKHIPPHVTKMQEEIAALKADNQNLRTVMIAAAEEISRYWDAHCDEEGYGPVNLLHRLEAGIPSEYGYTAGAFATLQGENAALKAELAEAKAEVARVRVLLDSRVCSRQEWEWGDEQ